MVDQVGPQFAEMLEAMRKLSESQVRTRLGLALRDFPDPAFKRRASIIVKGMDLQSGQRILDIGCGRGKFEAILSAVLGKVELVGIDLNVKRLRQAKPLIGPGMQIICADATSLPFRDMSFDRVIASEILEHLPDDERSLTEITRVLSDGFALISVPHADYPFSWDPVNYVLEKLTGTHVPSRMTFVAGIWADHRRLYREEELLSKVRAHGLNVLGLWRSTQVCLPFVSLVLNMAAAFLDRVGSQRLQRLRRPVGGSGSPFIRRFTRLIDLVDGFNASGSAGPRYVNLIIKARKTQ